MAPLRWGIAGCGRIGGKFIDSVHTLPDIEHVVAACAARDAERAEKFAKKFSIPKSYGSYQEMASDPNIDIVYVATVHITHCKLSCLFLNSGKAVLCEKPLALNIKQVQKMINVAKKNNVFFMEAIWSRFFPVYDRLREELKKGTVGDVQHVSANFGRLHLMKVERIANKSVGGGVLMDIGCYVLQFALHVYGEEPEQIQAVGHLNDEGVDCFQNITLTFSGNRTAQLTVHGMAELRNNAVVCGTKGIIEIPKMFWCPTEILVNDEKFEYPLPDGRVSSFGYAYEAEACRQAILKGLKEHPLMTHENSLTLSKVLDQLKDQLRVKYDCDDK